MAQIKTINILALNEDTKKYELVSPAVLNKSIVWDNPKSEKLETRYSGLSSNFSVVDPNSITKFFVDGWLVESDEYNNITLSKKVKIDETFTVNESKTKLTAAVPLPEYLLASNSYDIIQCTNGTTEEILQHCIISAYPVLSGKYINTINVTLFKPTMVDVADGSINIFDDEELQNGDGYQNQYFYITIKGSTII